MRLQELFETTEDDREISRLSATIYNYIADNYGGMDVTDIPQDIGTVGDATGIKNSLLSDVNIKLVPDEVLKKRARTEAEKEGKKIDPYMQKSTVGTWHAYHHGIELNTDFLNSNALKSTIAHELRHALDDIKSGNWANAEGNRYTTPKKKEHRVAKDDSDKTPYLAEPAEINARFMEVQHKLAEYIPRIYKKFKPEEIKPKILHYISRLFEEYRIAQLFPEKTESRDYKQLMKRVMAFASAEMKDAEQAAKKNAQGNW
jgi:predicted SprT family Zn-dependent metalloprotease